MKTPRSQRPEADDRSRAPALSSGQLAQHAGVGVQTLRYYERRGLLPEPRRARGTQRRYGAEDVRIVRFIKRTQALGFSLDEIQEMLDLRSEPDHSCVTVQEKVALKIQEIEARIRDLEAMRRSLSELVGRCAEEETVQDCVILRAFDDGIATLARTIRSSLRC
jgi:MerR family copper efflux transcriptional regulator